MKVKGSVESQESFESEVKRGSQLKGDFKKKQGHTRCELRVEVKGSVESQGKALKVKGSVESQEKL